MTSILNRRYLNSILERDVPSSVLLAHARMGQGKTDEEIFQLKEKLADEIEATYPLLKKTTENPES
ncbi:MAG: hypothetical protein IJ719_17590 [Clostridia bacterium]|nr:hypothetical protein [Clostridia bacterium]